MKGLLRHLFVALLAAVAVTASMPMPVSAAAEHAASRAHTSSGHPGASSVRPGGKAAPLVIPRLDWGIHAEDENTCCVRGMDAPVEPTAVRLRGAALSTVMAGLVPAIHVVSTTDAGKAWMAGTSPAMTSADHQTTATHAAAEPAAHTASGNATHGPHQVAAPNDARNATAAGADEDAPPCPDGPPACCTGGLCPMMHCGALPLFPASAGIRLPQRPAYDGRTALAIAGVSAPRLFRPPIAAA